MQPGLALDQFSCLGQVQEGGLLRGSMWPVDMAVLHGVARLPLKVLRRSLALAVLSQAFDQL